MPLHALLVGINQYHPQSGVSSLSGCLNDVKAMEAYLKKHFTGDQQHITTLVNEAATRGNVINAFKETLAGSEVQEGDIVLFFYSGHGSYAPSAPEFVALGLDTMGKDETLVLYDSRLPGNFDLADKELALLLAAINQSATIVVILDSCHSGSATRDISRADEVRLGLPRFTPASVEVENRSLDQYVSLEKLDYRKMTPVKIPFSKHVLLAACGREELAYEAAEPRGLFTSLLLKVVEQSPSDISYAQLFQYLYTQIKNKARKQTPQLKVYDGFNPNQGFLSNKVSAGKPAYTVSYNGQEWMLNYGALNGMPVDSKIVSDVKIALYESGVAGSQQVATATVLKPRLNESVLSLPADIDKSKTFDAEILNHPPSLYVYVRGDAGDINKFQMLLGAQLLGTAALLIHQDEQAFYDTILEVNGGEIKIIDAATKKLLHGIQGIDQYTVPYITEALLQIGKWRNLVAMHHNQTDINENNIEFNLQIRDADDNWVNCEGNEITLDITKERPEIPFRIHLASKSAVPYFVALYRLSPSFAIEKYTEDTDASVLSSSKIPAIECNTSDDTDPYKFSMSSEENEETEIYKLAVSKQEFYDYFIEERNELEPRVLAKVPGRAKGITKPSKGDWMIKTLTVRLVRQLQQVDSNRGFSNELLSIQPHPSFSASVSLTPLETAARDINPLSVLKDIFSGDEFSFMNLSPATRGDNSISESVIELTGIKGEEALSEDPLQLNLHYVLQENEQVLALTMSDGLVMPLGLLQKSPTGDDHSFYLYQAPATMDVRREAGKNPVRALWFCFLKVVLKKDDEVFKLRAVEYKDGKVGYSHADLEDTLKDKNNILLAIHGIIGNTKSIVANLGFLVDDKQYPYDCIIAFDYENLDTDIREIAAKLHKKLTEAGISKNKKIDLLVHSMGGLVGRYFVEKLGGHEMVNRFFLVGVPNDGSSFGKLVSMRNWAIGVLTVVCNYGKQFLGQFGPFLSAVNGALAATKPITNTLEEMNTGSDFLKELNKSNGVVVSTKYFVLAGNTSHYLLTDESFGKKAMEKIKLAVGKLAYWSVENDIAVSVESIKKIPSGVLVKETEVGCHHMNYFEYDKSLDVLKELMK